MPDEPVEEYIKMREIAKEKREGMEEADKKKDEDEEK